MTAATAWVKLSNETSETVAFKASERSGDDSVNIDAPKPYNSKAADTLESIGCVCTFTRVSFRCGMPQTRRSVTTARTLAIFRPCVRWMDFHKTHQANLLLIVPSGDGVGVDVDVGARTGTGRGRGRFHFSLSLLNSSITLNKRCVTLLSTF